ncbi:MAG: DUF503 domain-containing protein [Fimbriimonas sp.]
MLRMILGTLELDLRLDGCFSLKDKRQVLRSLLDRLRRDLHVAANEVGDHDLWNSAVLGIACVTNDTGVADGVLDRVLAMVDAYPAIEVVMVGRSVERR